MQTPDLDAAARRIWALIGALSEAFWRRTDEPGFSMVQALWRNLDHYTPESDDELALWRELTAPHNHAAVARYVELGSGKVSEYAAQLHATIMEASRRRWESEGPVA
jgi:hypothetical protein